MARDLELWLDAAAGCSLPPGCYAAARGTNASYLQLVHCEPRRASRLCDFTPGTEPAVIDVFQHVGSIPVGQLASGMVGEAKVRWPGSPDEVSLRVAMAEAGAVAFPMASKEDDNQILEVHSALMQDLEVAAIKAENLAKLAAPVVQPPLYTEVHEKSEAEQALPIVDIPMTRTASGDAADGINSGLLGGFTRAITDIQDEEGSKLYQPVMLNNCNQILPFLYLGGVEAVADTQCVVEQGIRAVVCCLREFEFSTKEFNKDLEYYRVDVEDQSREPIDLFFPEATEFIHSWVSREQPVLVHCRAGVSRSASVVMSYLVTYHGYSLHDAFFLVRSHRPIVSPNVGFMEKLCDYEEAKRGTEPTVDVNKYHSWYATPERPALPDLVPE